MKVVLFLIASAVTAQVSIKGKVALPEEASQKKTHLKLRYAGQTGLGKKKDPSASQAVIYLEGIQPSAVEKMAVEMKQEGMEFRPRVLAIQTGTTVKFTNDDDIYHNVLSYAETRRFDLGRYPKGEAREVKFDKPGVVDVYCEIHEHMRAFIIVVDNPYFATAGEDGSYEIKNVPAGKYNLVAWHEGFEAVRQEIEVASDALKVDMKLAKFMEREAGDSIFGGGCCKECPK